jgi:hypothetical protein
MLRAATIENDLHSNVCTTRTTVGTFCLVSVVTHGCLQRYTTMGTDCL